MVEIGEKFFAVCSLEWRKWLLDNCDKQQEIWLVYYKKHTQKPSISYKESVEEAICFGWIDGVKKRIDDETYTHRFSPRKSKSKWSKTNIAIAEKMTKLGKITKHGLSLYKDRGEYQDKLPSDSVFELMNEIQKELQKNEIAWQNFSQLTKGCKKQYIIWLNNAKKPETRKKRIKEAVSLLLDNKKLGMK